MPEKGVKPGQTNGEAASSLHSPQSRNCSGRGTEILSRSTPSSACTSPVPPRVPLRGPSLNMATSSGNVSRQPRSISTSPPAMDHRQETSEMTEFGATTAHRCTVFTESGVRMVYKTHNSRESDTMANTPTLRLPQPSASTQRRRPVQEQAEPQQETMVDSKETTRLPPVAPRRVRQKPAPQQEPGVLPMLRATPCSATTTPSSDEPSASEVNGWMMVESPRQTACEVTSQTSTSLACHRLQSQQGTPPSIGLAQQRSALAATRPTPVPRPRRHPIGGSRPTTASVTRPAKSIDLLVNSITRSVYKNPDYIENKWVLQGFAMRLGISRDDADAVYDQHIGKEGGRGTQYSNIINAYMTTWRKMWQQEDLPDKETQIALLDHLKKAELTAIVNHLPEDLLPSPVTEEPAYLVSEIVARVLETKNTSRPTACTETSDEGFYSGGTVEAQHRLSES